MIAMLVMMMVAAAARPSAHRVPSGEPGPVAALVRASVAQAWGVDEAAIVLDWGRAGEPAGEYTSVELLGDGSGGVWVARLRTALGEGVAVRVRAGSRVTEPVAARRLPRGTVLTTADLDVGESTQWGPPRAEAAGSLEGWVTQRSLDQGDPLAPPAVRAPWLVVAGDEVEIRLGSESVRLRLIGVATGSAALGEDVNVRAESGARLRGVVVGEGAVDVTPAHVNRSRGDK